MDLVIIFSTITAFFTHYLIDRAVVANTVSAIVATAIIWVLIVIIQAGSISDADGWVVLVTFLIAFVVSTFVGMIFKQHKECSK